MSESIIDLTKPYIKTILVIHNSITEDNTYTAYLHTVV